MKDQFISIKLFPYPIKNMFILLLVYLAFILRKYSLLELIWTSIICIPFQSAFKKTGSICTFENWTAFWGIRCMESLYSIKQV